MPQSEARGETERETMRTRTGGDMPIHLWTRNHAGRNVFARFGQNGKS